MDSESGVAGRVFRQADQSQARIVRDSPLIRKALKPRYDGTFFNLSSGVSDRPIGASRGSAHGVISATPEAAGDERARRHLHRAHQATVNADVLARNVGRTF